MSSTADLVCESSTDLSKKHKPDEKKPTPTFKSLPVSAKLQYIREVITIEPIVVCYLLSSIICYPALSQLEIEKACSVNLQLNATICDAIISGEEHAFDEESVQVQTAISNMHAWQGPLQTFMPLVLILFIGSYSDRHRLRKPFFLLPIFGEFFAVAGCILCVVFKREWPLEVQGVLQQVIPSFFGGQAMLIMAIFSYIADVSSLEMRTVRIGAVQITLNVAIPVGQFLSGILFDIIGYYGVLGIAAGLFLFALLYGAFWVKEEKKDEEEADKKPFLVDLFDPKHALETLNVVLKKSPGNNRLFIVLVFVLMSIYAIVAVGESSVFYLYVVSNFHWTPTDYSYYSTTSTIVHLIGTSIGVPLFSKFFKLNDFNILILTMADFIIVDIINGLARSTVMLYVGAVCGIITGISVIGIRSLATKVVSPSDFGKSQSLYGIGEALGPLVGIPLYNTIYVNTLKTLPSAYFFFGSLFYLFLVFIVVFMFIRDRRSNAGSKQGETNYANNIKMEDHQSTHM